MQFLIPELNFFAFRKNIRLILSTPFCRIWQGKKILVCLNQKFGLYGIKLRSSTTKVLQDHGIKSLPYYPGNKARGHIILSDTKSDTRTSCRDVCKPF